MTKKVEVTGTLEGWVYDPFSHVVLGYIHGDERKRWEDGRYIHTSTLQHSRKDAAKFEEGDIIHTRNSTYKLGKKHVPASWLVQAR